MRSKPNSCMGCSCHGHGTDFSRVTGTGSLGVMIVAEASGEHEQREQEPLVKWAPAGSLLERTIRRMGLDRQQFSITNTLRCRPRNNWLEGAPWEHAALRHCRPNLDAAIAERRPRVIFALGNIPLRELTGMAGEAQGISHLTGYVLRGPNDIPVIPTYHPAFIRRGQARLQGLFARNLARAVRVAAGKDTQWIWNLEEAQRDGRLRYLTHPSIDDARSFLERVRSGSNLPLSYDLETFESASLDEDARDGFTDTRIRLVQFSLGAGGGIALPWEGGYRDIARDLLATPNTKCGHNLWLFDNKVLRAAGEREGIQLQPRGVIHDTLQMFHHWQPDLPAHLQAAAQFVEFPFPWKHLAGTDLEFYGCVDVDATLRLYEFLCDRLRKDGLWDDLSYQCISAPLISTSVPSASGNGHTEIAPVKTVSTVPVDTAGTPTTGNSRGYIGQVLEVRPVLARMEERGLPVDDVERLKLDAEFDAAQQELGAELDRRFPDEVRSIHPKEGYKKLPKDLAGLVERDFLVAGVDDAGNPRTDTIRRWCRLEEFSPNSWQQLIRYMKARKHKVPKSKKNEDAEGKPKDTTEKKELVRLAHRYDDNFYLKVIEYRELSKMRGTYIDGFKPHEDGRVHTTFTFDTGTGQLSTRNPNIQNIPEHVRLAHAIKRMYAAPPGHVLTKWDYKAFHVLTTGFEAESANWMRLARLDMHSFVAWHFLKLPGADSLMSLPDEDFMDHIRWFRSDEKREFVRNKQAKPSDLGIGFGMGFRRLYQENMEYFEGEKQAKRFHDLLQALFPEVFAWQAKIRMKAHNPPHQLVSAWGNVRRFYEVFRWNFRLGLWDPGDQAEEAVAFLPANDAHGHMRDKKKALESRGLADKYGLCNEVHDAWWFCFPRPMLDEHIAELEPVLLEPSKILTHPVLAPDGLWCATECKHGQNLAEMETVRATTKNGALAGGGYYTGPEPGPADAAG